MGVSSALGSAGAVPIGVVVPFAGSTAPAGWLLCFGQAVSRTTYAGLFSTISTTYGSGDGSTTFALPDLRGRAISGLDNMGGSAASRLTAAGSGITGTTLGATGGTETHTMTTAQMPSHTHTQDAHSHTIFENGSNGSQVGGHFTSGSGSIIYTAQAGTTGVGAAMVNSNTTATNQNTGGGGAHQNTQPTIILNYIIKAQ